MRSRRPPDVDAALRQNVTKFYQAHVDKKYRLAEQVVAEDSKDLFYGLNKVACLSFKIDKIVYSDNFTKAKSTVLCNQYLPFPGFEKPVDVPIPDTWKIENGQWSWYMDLSHGRDTPFGHQNPPKEGAPVDGPAPAMVSIDAIMKSVQADKNAVLLSSKEPSSDVVRIANVLPGPVTLRLDAGRRPV